jgi:hypothetical protein
MSEDTFVKPEECTGYIKFEEDWISKYEPFENYVADFKPDYLDYEDRLAYGVKLLKYCAFSKACDCIVEAPDGKQYYLWCRAWWLPTKEEPYCLISEVRGQWCMNYDHYCYGTGEDRIQN